MLDRLIQNITDVPDVEGVCIFGLEGQLAVNGLPDFFMPELFEDLARRIISMFETVDDSYLPTDEYLLKYNSMWLSIRRGKSFFLVVLCKPAVNSVSLRMVCNLALKNISLEMLESAYADVETKPKPVNGYAKTAPQPPAALPQARVAEVKAPAEPEPAAAAPRGATRPKRAYRGSSY